MQVRHHLRNFSYFYYFHIFVATYTLFYFKKRNRRMFSTFLILYCLLFIGYMYNMEENTSLFIFCWQNEYFDIKQKLY